MAVLEALQQIEIIRVRMKEATEIGLECLRLLRFELASMEEVETLAKDSARVYEALDCILSQGELTDPYYLTVTRVLICLTGCSFFHPSRVFSQIAHAQISVASSFGITMTSAFALSTYSHVLWGRSSRRCATAMGARPWRYASATAVPPPRLA